MALNLMQKGKADYVVTGHFAKKAAQEAKKFGEVNIAASTEPENFSRIPKQEELKLGCGCGLCLYLQQQYRIWNRVELCSAD